MSVPVDDSHVPPPFLEKWWAARAGEGPVSRSLPDFPWDKLTAYAAQARAHHDGIVDLSVGTPVDPTPSVVQEALRGAADSPGYPTTVGRADTRQAAVDWLARRFGVTGLGLDGVLPVIGSKELIASLPSHLGLGPRDLVVYPALAYPTYEVGARLAGARAVATDSLTSVGPEKVALVWINSPSNPTGRVLPVEHLRKVVAWARERGALLVSDECYLECAWESTDGRGPVSVLHPDVCDGDHSGILAVHSLSKRSNLAGYRCAFVAGDTSAGRRAARRAQEPRAPDARSAAGRDEGGARRRRARRRAARALRGPAHRPARRARGRRVPGRPLGGVALPVGDP